MIAYLAIFALFGAGIAQEDFEGLDSHEIVFYETDEEEVAFDEASEYLDQVFFEDESEIIEELLEDDD